MGRKRTGTEGLTRRSRLDVECILSMMQGNREQRYCGNSAQGGGTDDTAWPRHARAGQRLSFPCLWQTSRVCYIQVTPPPPPWVDKQGGKREGPA